MAKQIANISINTERIWSQLMELAEIGKQESGGVTRTSLSPEDLPPASFSSIGYRKRAWRYGWMKQETL
ncbi:hypothetical protein V7266_18730 [Neobacillus drentensis]|uniref:hypothetical protein n=1 Tax=Neobacillus drentensis TaxID=220684 RepID=UPI002FFF3E84